MSFQQKLQVTLVNSFDPILKQLAEYYELDFGDLKEVTTEILTVSTVCQYKFVRGQNKGKNCPKRPSNGNGYCSTHQNSAVKLQTVTGEVKPPKAKPISKTRQQIIDWLNTAVPQEETILKRHELGLIHEETEIIFSPNFVVVGRLNKDRLDKLSDFEIEMCEKRGWAYAEECIYSDSSESD